MAEERGKRRRGRRRGRGGQDARRPIQQEDQQQSTPDLEITEEEDVPGTAGRRINIWRRRPREGKPAAPVRRSGHAQSAASAPAGTSPMDFWRSGQARTYRDPAVQRKGMSLRKRITSLYFPPWVPVAGIIVVVFGILAVLFYSRTAVGAPRINDHWHAAYAIFIGDQRQPNIPTFTGPEEIHTHGDGIIHEHPFIPAGEGSGAAIGRFFQYGGGKLTDSELKIPGHKESYKNGDSVPRTDKTGVVRILRADSGIHPLGSGFSQAIQNCDAKPESEFQPVNSRYIPKDGDCIRIIFGPPEVPVVVQSDRTIIAPEDATRTIDLDVTGSGANTAFSPASLELKTGEIVKIVLRNKSVVEDPAKPPFHGFRSSGVDKQYGTQDDFVLDSPTLDPGQEGTAVIRFETAGEFEFRDEAATEGVTPVTGKITVSAAPATSPTPTPNPEEQVDVSLDVALTDAGYQPTGLTVKAGQRFRLDLTNSGAFIHNLCSPGPDGMCRTDDDIVPSTDVSPGETGSLIGKIDTPGTYEFHDSFHPTQITGTITVE